MEKEMSIKKAAIINGSSKYFSIICNLFFSAVLARILTPQDFGIVAVTTVFTTFFSLLSDMGIGAGVIQNKHLKMSEVNGIFSFTLIISIFMGMFFGGFSFFLVKFYENSVYYGIGAMLSFSLIMSVMNTVPNALLMKNKLFVTVAIRNIVVPIITSIIAIFFAWEGFKYYALVMQTILSSIIMFVANFFTVHKRYQLNADVTEIKNGIKKILNFSVYQLAFNIINYFSRNIDNLLISKIIGINVLGQYDKAYKLTLYPIQNLTHVITPVMHPILSEYQDNKEYVYEKYINILKILSLMGVIITPICIFCAKDIILIMFGIQWIEAIPCFKYLSISIWAQLLMGSSGSIYQSLNKTKLMFVSGLITAFFTIISILIGIHTKNIVNVAICVTIAFNINFFITFFILIKIAFKKSILDFFVKLTPDLGIGVLISTFLFFLSRSFSNTNIIIDMFIKSFLSVIIYIFLIIIFKQSKYFNVFLVFGKMKMLKTAKQRYTAKA